MPGLFFRKIGSTRLLKKSKSSRDDSLEEDCVARTLLFGYRAAGRELDTLKTQRKETVRLIRIHFFTIAPPGKDLSIDRLRAYGRTRVLILFGTSPTGMTATCFSVSVSIAETDFAAEFET